MQLLPFYWNYCNFIEFFVNFLKLLKLLQFYWNYCNFIEIIEILLQFHWNYCNFIETTAISLQLFKFDCSFCNLIATLLQKNKTNIDEKIFHQHHHQPNACLLLYICNVWKCPWNIFFVKCKMLAIIITTTGRTQIFFLCTS